MKNVFIRRIVTMSIVNWILLTIIFGSLHLVLELKEDLKMEWVFYILYRKTNVIVIATYINMLVVFLFLSRIRLAEIQLQASLNPHLTIVDILNKIKQHIKIYRISVAVIFGYLVTYFVGQLYQAHIEVSHVFKLIDIVWIIIFNFLLVPIAIYYSLMIDRFILLLSVNFNIR